MEIVAIISCSIFVEVAVGKAEIVDEIFVRTALLLGKVGLGAPPPDAPELLRILRSRREDEDEAPLFLGARRILLP